ncbi:MAG: hypothetical protein PHH28_05615 [Desulfuromonadaceae bacterium]|nr:hypothetical protein [Desulfuromonadaceae bacterium]
MKNKDTYHEAGHLVMALLFPDDVIIQSITLDASTYSDHVNTEDWKGGIHLKPNRPSKERDCEYLNKINIILLAGLCAQNIFDKSTHDAACEIPNYIESPDSTMDRDGITGDWEFISRNLREPMEYFKFEYNDNGYKQYSKLIMQYIFYILQEEKVREFMDNISLLLITQHTLCTDDILQISHTTGFSKYLNDNDEHFNQKYNALFVKCTP